MSRRLMTEPDRDGAARHGSPAASPPAHCPRAPSRRCGGLGSLLESGRWAPGRTGSAPGGPCTVGAGTGLRAGPGPWLFGAEAVLSLPETHNHGTAEVRAPEPEAGASSPATCLRPREPVHPPPPARPCAQPTWLPSSGRPCPPSLVAGQLQQRQDGSGGGALAGGLSSPDLPGTPGPGGPHFTALGSRPPPLPGLSSARAGDIVTSARPEAGPGSRPDGGSLRQPGPQEAEMSWSRPSEAGTPPWGGSPSCTLLDGPVRRGQPARPGLGLEKQRPAREAGIGQPLSLRGPERPPAGRPWPGSRHLKPRASVRQSPGRGQRSGLADVAVDLRAPWPGGGGAGPAAWIVPTPEERPPREGGSGRTRTCGAGAQPALGGPRAVTRPL